MHTQPVLLGRGGGEIMDYRSNKKMPKIAWCGKTVHVNGHGKYSKDTASLPPLLMLNAKLQRASSKRYYPSVRTCQSLEAAQKAQNTTRPDLS